MKKLFAFIFAFFFFSLVAVVQKVHRLRNQIILRRKWFCQNWKRQIGWQSVQMPKYSISTVVLTIQILSMSLIIRIQFL